MLCKAVLSIARRSTGRAVWVARKEGVRVSYVVAKRNFSIDYKAQAHEDLKNAVKELSEGESVPISYAPISTLLQWDEKPLDSLTIDQLEELARAWYEGVEDDDDSMEPDYERAIEVWTEGIARGSTESKYSRAVCMRQGLGCEMDSAGAFTEMLELAEKQNYALAHYAVGIMLSSGEGTPVDHTKAFHHFNEAGKAGITPALYNMGNAFASGQGVAQDFRKAFMAYEGAAEVGDPAAKFTLGTWYYKGINGVTVNKMKAFKLQLEAAEAGHVGAMFNTGAAFMEGEGAGVRQDFAKAAEWYAKAAERNFPQANVNLGNMYMVGYGVPRDLRKALEIFKRYADRDEVNAALAAEAQRLIDEEANK